MKKTAASALGVIFFVGHQVDIPKTKSTYTILHHFKVVLILCKHRLPVSYTNRFRGIQKPKKNRCTKSDSHGQQLASQLFNVHTFAAPITRKLKDLFQGVFRFSYHLSIMQTS